MEERMFLEEYSCMCSYGTNRSPGKTAPRFSSQATATPNVSVMALRNSFSRISFGNPVIWRRKSRTHSLQSSMHWTS